MKLYQYEHCPYCIRVKMVTGYKNLPVEHVVLLNDDEDTPISKIGKKMVPIWEDDNVCMGESLEIIEYLNTKYPNPAIDLAQERKEIAEWIAKVNEYSNKLCFPTFVQTKFKEFASQKALDYYINKKTKSIGDLQELRANKQSYLEQVNNDFLILDKIIRQNIEILTKEDILLFPLLKNLSLVDGVVFPAHVKNYFDNITKLISFN